jgi:predicted  nucleic acid-binding Zn-ribbon protein
MPHQCTDCGRRFDDGSKEMLSGCPDCGGNKFQFHPDGVDDPAGSEEPPDPPEPPEPPEPAVDSTVARTVGNAATAVRDLVGGDSTPPEPADADAAEPLESPAADSATADSPAARIAERENEAQASARSEVVSPDDLPAASRSSTTTSQSRQSTPGSTAGSTDSTTPDPSSVDERAAAERQDRPDLSELREELNEQFESIRVLEPGQYELNLMSLYDREEYIIALQEDGKYTIQVPERWEE